MTEGWKYQGQHDFVSNKTTEWSPTEQKVNLLQKCYTNEAYDRKNKTNNYV